MNEKDLIPWHYYYVHNAKLKQKIRKEDIEILQWNGTNWNLKLAIIPSKTYLAITEVPEVDLSLYETNPRHYGSLHCNHCGKDVFKEIGDYFMLKDEIWQQVCNNNFVSKTHVLCKKCTEHYLGRELTLDDYNDAPVNSAIFHQDLIRAK
jgi:hypothetical protein